MPRSRRRSLPGARFSRKWKPSSFSLAYGIPTVPTQIARDPAEVGALAAGFIAEHGACVVKILSDDISP